MKNAFNCKETSRGFHRYMGFSVESAGAGLVVPGEFLWVAVHTL